MIATFPFPRIDGETFTAREEHGWWPGKPTDPHPTLNGVTQETYDAFRDRHGLPRQSVQRMAPLEQTAIYDGFWVACRGVTVAEASSALAICHFDAAFNSGAPRAAKLLQQSVGVDQDGVLGPASWAALAASVTNTEAGTVMAYLQNRWDFLQTLGNFAAWRTIWGARENRLGALCGVPWTVS